MRQISPNISLFRPRLPSLDILVSFGPSTTFRTPALSFFFSSFSRSSSIHTLTPTPPSIFRAFHFREFFLLPISTCCSSISTTQIVSRRSATPSSPAARFPLFSTLDRRAVSEVSGLCCPNPDLFTWSSSLALSALNVVPDLHATNLPTLAYPERFVTCVIDFTSSVFPLFPTAHRYQQLNISTQLRPLAIPPTIFVIYPINHLLCASIAAECKSRSPCTSVARPLSHPKASLHCVLSADLVSLFPSPLTLHLLTITLMLHSLVFNNYKKSQSNDHTNVRFGSAILPLHTYSELS